MISEINIRELSKCQTLKNETTARTEATKTTAVVPRLSGDIRYFGKKGINKMIKQ